MSDSETWYPYATGVYIPPGGSLRMIHVTVEAEDAQNRTTGIMLDGDYEESISAIAILDTVTIYASFNRAVPVGPVINPSTYGIDNNDTSLLTMTTSSVSVSGGQSAFGISDVRARAFIYDSRIDIKPGILDVIWYVGIYNAFIESDMYMRNSRLDIGGGPGYDAGSYVAGIWNNQTREAEIKDSTITVSGDDLSTYGILSYEGEGVTTRQKSG